MLKLDGKGVPGKLPGILRHPSKMLFSNYSKAIKCSFKLLSQNKDYIKGYISAKNYQDCTKNDHAMAGNVICRTRHGKTHFMSYTK